MTALRTPLPWPESVWNVPMFRGLDARAHAEIQAAGAVRRLRAGEVLFASGEPADALFVVASGSMTLSGVRRGEAAPSVIRRVRTGEVLGEEATVAAFTTRQLEARCDSDAVLAEIPLVVLKRAAGRAGGADHMAKVERALRRAATLDLLRTTSFTRGLSDADLEVLLDAARHASIPRGEHVFREGDVATDAFFVADGLLQAQTDDGGRPRVEAYLGRGDLFGDEELTQREPRGVSVVASGPAWLVAIPRDVFVVIARRNPAMLDGARRLRSEGITAMPRPGAQTTAHVFRDLYRMRVARSLLVIDQDSCIRCGHCAWSCADAHSDGVSRLVRRGDKIVVNDGAAIATTAPLLVPNSCQHCKNPSCMIDCPTGAIGRDARGEVFIREDLCTGCGSCAKACPWENIQMAPRTDTTAYPAVAVKCDLCKGIDGGPACVSACPTQAIARIDPNAALVELRIPSRENKGNKPAIAPVLGVRSPAWPWVVGGAFAGLGVALVRMDRWTSGVLAGLFLVLLVGYAAAKRLRGPLARLRGRVPLSRWLYIAHVSFGAFVGGLVVAHSGARIPSGSAGALTIALGLTLFTGALGAALNVLVPRMLSRVERGSVLPEELAALPKELDAKIFSTLSGKSELVKMLFVKALRPYRRSVVGPLVLLAGRRTLREEERAVRRRLDLLTGGKKGESVLGLDELTRLVVEHRAVRAQRLCTWALRGWLVPHLALTAATVVLVVLHVIAVSGGRGP
jgi:Fe-S-cluster-containing dehydrogenase component/CRP-like cAMP-binding protein